MVVESLDAAGKVTVFGSGVVIAPGHVITNRHVIEDGVSFRVVHNDKKWPAKLIRVDPDHDLAELSVAGLKAPAVTVLDSSKLAVGETVYAIGAPESLELTISEGLISGLRDFDKSLVIQTSAAISPGSSGGGLFDTQGRLVGITTFYLKEGQSLNFALPAEWMLALNRQPIKASPRVRKNSPEFQALLWFQIGYLAERAENYDSAAIAYREGLTLKPDDEGAWFLLGDAYLKIGRFDEAVSADREALQQEPNDELAWRVLGGAYGRLGEYDKAVSAFQEAIRLKPDDEIPWRALGATYGMLGQYGKAISAGQEAVRLKPDDALAWEGLGFAFKAKGEQSEVVKVYQKLKTLDPKRADQFFRAFVLP